MQDCFTYAQKTQRLAPSSSVSYRGRDGSCNYNGKANGLKGKIHKHLYRLGVSHHY